MSEKIDKFSTLTYTIETGQRVEERENATDEIWADLIFHGLCVKHHDANHMRHILHKYVYTGIPQTLFMYVSHMNRNVCFSFL